MRKEAGLGRDSGRALTPRWTEKKCFEGVELGWVPRRREAGAADQTRQEVKAPPRWALHPRRLLPPGALYGKRSQDCSVFPGAARGKEPACQCRRREM